MSVTMRCTVLAETDEVVLHDNEEIVPVQDGFTGAGELCSLSDPDLAIIIAGPRRNGSWVTVVLDAEPHPTVH
jgi:hypothetical protein